MFLGAFYPRMGWKASQNNIGSQDSPESIPSGRKIGTGGLDTRLPIKVLCWPDNGRGMVRGDSQNNTGPKNSLVSVQPRYYIHWLGYFQDCAG